MKHLLLVLGIVLLAGCLHEAQPTAQQGDVVKVDYVGQLENGIVFDTSIKSEAEKAGLPLRESYAPLEFTVGSGQLIKGFDSGVVGMKQGEQKTVTIPASEAYGEINQALIAQVPRQNIQGDVQRDIQIGAVISGGDKVGRVIEVSNETVTVNFNHELAGKTLVFKITVVSIAKKK